MKLGTTKQLNGRKLTCKIPAVWCAENWRLPSGKPLTAVQGGAKHQPIDIIQQQTCKWHKLCTALWPLDTFWCLPPLLMQKEQLAGSSEGSELRAAGTATVHPLLPRGRIWFKLIPNKHDKTVYKSKLKHTDAKDTGCWLQHRCPFGTVAEVQMDFLEMVVECSRALDLFRWILAYKCKSMSSTCFWNKLGEAVSELLCHPIHQTFEEKEKNRMSNCN